MATARLGCVAIDYQPATINARAAGLALAHNGKRTTDNGGASNVSWDSYRRIATHPDVAWIIPLSPRDTHRGFRVLGTNASAILTSLNERRREMAILRSVGARPWQIFLLFVSEAAILACAGVLLGISLIYALLFFAQPFIAGRLGMSIALDVLTGYDLGLLALVVGAALVMSALPAGGPTELPKLTVSRFDCEAVALTVVG